MLARLALRPLRRFVRSLFLIASLVAAPLAAGAQDPQNQEVKILFGIDTNGLLDSTPQDSFGHSIALEGDRLIVGAALQNEGVLLDVGAAYAFGRDAVSGEWILEAKLEPDPVLFPPVTGDRRGTVALSGDWAAVASPGVGAADAGAVDLYERVAGAWIWARRIGGTAGGDEFGDLAMEGDVLVVGARNADVVGPPAADNGGRVHIFLRSAAGLWFPGPVLTQPGGAEDGARFGSVAISGDRIVVGSARARVAAGLPPVPVDSGEAYVFLRTDGADPVDPLDDQWVLEDTINAQLAAGTADSHGGMRFGESVGIDGDTIVVGAARKGIACSTTNPDIVGCEVGAAYVYTRSGTDWQIQARLTDPDGHFYDRFGSAVAIEGETILIAAINEDGPLMDSGAVFRFERAGATWTLVDTYGGCSVGELFGGSLAIDLGPPRETLAVGSLFAFLPNGPTGESMIAGSVTLLEDDGVFEMFPEFCFGDGGLRVSGQIGADVGCTPCPCANDAPAGTRGGCLNTNTVPTSGRLVPGGVPSLASDTLTFGVMDAEINSFAVLTSGASRQPIGALNPCPCGTGLTQTGAAAIDGLRCVGVGVLRHGSRSTDGTGATINSWPGTGPALLGQFSVVVGQSRHFQAVYRVDPTRGCGTGQNSTQGITVVVEP